MPGIVRGVARTAVVAGTASAVSGRVHHRQQQQWAEQGSPQTVYVEQAPPPPQNQQPPPAPAQDDSIEQLKKLAELNKQGIITDEEFAAKKKQLLGI